MPGTLVQELNRILNRMREKGVETVWLSPHNVNALSRRPVPQQLRPVAPVAAVTQMPQMPSVAVPVQTVAPAVPVAQAVKVPVANVMIAAKPEPAENGMFSLPEGWRDRVNSSNWEELEDLSANCNFCQFSQGGCKGLFHAGRRKPCVLFIGDYPNAEEWSTGEAFAGRAGEMLYKMGTAMGLSWMEGEAAPGAAYVNVLKCRPSAMPEQQQLNICLVILQRQIQLMEPSAIVFMGALPLKTLCGKHSFNDEKGKWQMYGDISGVSIQSTVQIMRQEGQVEEYKKERRQAWNTLQMLVEYLKTQNKT